MSILNFRSSLFLSGKARRVKLSAKTKPKILPLFFTYVSYHNVEKGLEWKSESIQIELLMNGCIFLYVD